MRRREFTTLLCAAISTLPTLAHGQLSHLPRVGILWHAGSAAEEGAYYTALVDGFRELGYIDGQNISLEHRFPNELPDLFRSMVADLIQSKVDVLVTVGTQTAPYARDATTTVPVVFIFVPDPVGSKFVRTLHSPGRNMTGLSQFGADIVLKRLQLLKYIIPDLSRVAVLVNSNTEVARLYRDVTDTAAAELGLQNHAFDARSLSEVASAFDAMLAAGKQAVTINGEGLAYQHRAKIAEMAVSRRLPLAVWSKETFEAGAMMSYGADQVAMARRGASFVHKILKGSNPSDLPVEQPTKLEFFINLKVATRLGLTIPPALLSYADEVVE
jgi:putative tryptophan/tyrosine transport system substrate-binding protein